MWSFDPECYFIFHKLRSSTLVKPFSDLWPDVCDLTIWSPLASTFQTHHIQIHEGGQHILPSQRLLLLSPVCRIPPRVYVNLDAVWQCQCDLQYIVLVVLQSKVTVGIFCLDQAGGKKIICTSVTLTMLNTLLWEIRSVLVILCHLHSSS